ncbi:hypothetical protein KM295_07805 [Natronomonas sp. F2-12]|jgi:hypothetical protein|uniref:Uncharacterized protein n=1 Tax=Natronomonas aquatica TaxID=2841590 RepID=A0A9R1CTH1_9EURY|nr:hypothetical protein [Natronomonas aquatica]MCQ4333384.1 hypothetical protein [Natronomonas aquatica]
MDWPKLLSVAIVLLVIVWSAGATVELIATTLSIGPNVVPAAVAVAFLAFALVVAIGVGARSRRWLENPRSYW